MRFDIITIFPAMFTGFLSAGVLKKAIEKGLIEVNVHDLRDYTRDKHRQVDDRPFGGSPGMVLKPEPIFRTVDTVKKSDETAICLLSPQGRRFNSEEAKKLSKKDQVVLICGRYEGVDERVAENCATEEISIGDYVLSGGEPAAMVLIDAVARLVPGVVGKPESVENESFNQGRLDYPQYTRPREYRGLKVPELLFSGDHKQIDRWRRKKALEKTRRFRPALLKKNSLSQKDKDILDEINKERETYEYHGDR